MPDQDQRFLPPGGAFLAEPETTPLASLWCLNA